MDNSKLLHIQKTFTAKFRQMWNRLREGKNNLNYAATKSIAYFNAMKRSVTKMRASNISYKKSKDKSSRKPNCREFFR